MSKKQLVEQNLLPAVLILDTDGFGFGSPNRNASPTHTRDMWDACRIWAATWVSHGSSNSWTHFLGLPLAVAAQRPSPLVSWEHPGAMVGPAQDLATFPGLVQLEALEDPDHEVPDICGFVMLKVLNSNEYIMNVYECYVFLCVFQWMLWFFGCFLAKDSFLLNVLGISMAISIYGHLRKMKHLTVTYSNLEALMMKVEQVEQHIHCVQQNRWPFNLQVASPIGAASTWEASEGVRFRCFGSVPAHPPEAAGISKSFLLIEMWETMSEMVRLQCRQNLTMKSFHLWVVLYWNMWTIQR